LEERISGKPGPFHYEERETVCPHCGCGCNLLLNIKGDKLFTVSTRNTTPPSYGYTCRQGRFDSFAYLSKDKRLKTPLLKKDGKLVEASWEEALERVVSEFKRLKEEHGPGGLAAIGSPRATNEANYLLQKIFRNQLECNNLDYPGGQSHRATLSTLSQALGKSAMTNSFSQIEKAEIIFALGNAIEENNPVVATAMRRASRTHARRLITLSSSEVTLGKFADPGLVVPKEYMADFLQSLVKLMLELKLYHEDYVAAHTKGIEDLEKSLASFDHLDTLAKVDMRPSTFEDLARILADTASLAIVYSEDFTAQAKPTKKVAAIANLAMLTGRIGQPQSGIYPLYRQINAQGAMDMGMTPSYYPGHVRVSDLAVSDRFTKVWGGQVVAGAGLVYREIIEGAQQKQIKGLYLMGENPMATQPEREKVQQALKQVEFLVVQDMFLTQCGELADVILPSTASTEQEGTFTNTERRVQKLSPVLPAPGAALPDWRILADLLARLDPGATYQDGKSVYEEIMSVVPFYQGLTYELLQKGGIQWPYANGNSKGMLKLEDLKKPLEFAVSD
jgi:predicted molibdopterin-dependent oxidoreductase YjgC